MRRAEPDPERFGLQLLVKLEDPDMAKGATGRLRSSTDRRQEGLRKSDRPIIAGKQLVTDHGYRPTNRTPYAFLSGRLSLDHRGTSASLADAHRHC